MKHESKLVGTVISVIAVVIIGSFGANVSAASNPINDLALLFFGRHMTQSIFIFFSRTKMKRVTSFSALDILLLISWVYGFVRVSIPTCLIVAQKSVFVLFGSRIMREKERQPIVRVLLN